MQIFTLYRFVNTYNQFFIPATLNCDSNMLLFGSSATIIVVFIINSACCQNTSIPFKLSIERQPTNIDDFIVLVVSASKPIYSTTFSATRVQCFLNVRNKFTRPFERKVSVPFKELLRLDKNYIAVFQLDISKEGTVQCVYSEDSETVFWSNALYVIFTNTQYYAVGVISDRKLDGDGLSALIGARDVFGINSTERNNASFFTFTANVHMKSPEADSAVLRQIQNMLGKLSSLEYSINFTRSTRFCQPIRSLDITHTRVGFKSKNGQKCEGDEIIGAYWADPSLQQIIHSEINGSAVFTKLERTDLSSLDGIQNFSSGLSQTGAVNARELGVIVEKFNRLVTDEDGVLRATNFEQRLTTSNALLTSLDLVLANCPLPAGPVQLDLESFATRVENARDSGNNGVLINGSGIQMIPIQMETSNNFVVNSTPK